METTPLWFTISNYILMIPVFIGFIGLLPAIIFDVIKKRFKFSKYCLIMLAGGLIIFAILGTIVDL